MLNKKHSILSKSGKVILILAVPLFLSIAAYIFVLDPATHPDNALKIKMKDFPSGTKISYKASSQEGGTLHTETAVLDQTGSLELFVPQEKSHEITSPLEYELNISNPVLTHDTKNQALNMLLSLDPKKKKIDIKTSGIDNKTALQMTDGPDVKTLKADWAGILAGTFQKTEQTPDISPIELAFQGINLQNDANSLYSGKVDIFFGIGTVEDISNVQSRYTPAMIQMAEELSAVMVKQTQMIGALMDARMQMTVQRKMQELMARAHKDYHPSEELCQIGTFVRSLANSESDAEINKYALNKILLDEYTGMFLSNATNVKEAITSRIEQFKNNYCNPHDNGGHLSVFCPNHINLSAKPAAERIKISEKLNNDINYTKTFLSKLTFDVDFRNDYLETTGEDIPGAVQSSDEEDLIALAKNLYYPEVFIKPTDESLAKSIVPFADYRSYVARLGVAQNSFINIIGMKSKSHDAPNNSAGTQNAGWNYMKALLLQMDLVDDNGNGSTEDEIHKLLGDNPSYYAQMEVMTKKIYQDPNFYTNLYDKPVNVDRIGAALDAISIMNQRDRFDSLLRSELITGLLVEQALKPDIERVNTQIYAGAASPDFTR